jgi:hypothetical protein
MGACFTVRAHDVITTKVTFSREISRLFNKSCVSCHHEGGSSFSLTTYEQARPWAKAIKEEVLERRMPPWGAVKGFGSFKNDQGLTQEQIELVSDWVEGGAPEGDPALLPKISKPTTKQTGLQSTRAELPVNGSVTLKQPAVLEGIRASALLEGTSVQVIARKPDGSIEPLIWLYQYQPRFDHPYYFRNALQLPAGTEIQTFPAKSGTVSLLLGGRTARAGNRPANPAFTSALKQAH